MGMVTANWDCITEHVVKHGQFQSKGRLIIYFEDSKLINSVAEFVNIPYTVSNNYLVYSGINSVDFVGKLYDNCKTIIEAEKLKDMLATPNIVPVSVQIQRTTEDAIFPKKENFSDVGYDLTIISVKKKIDNLTTLYDTGIKVFPPNGYYTEIVARSSLSKTGYMLSNNIGIIDPSYRGNLFISLTKINPESKDIQLPFKGFQLIIRKQEYAEFTEIEDEIAIETSRNSGGFGSTNK